jgi:RNA polymerase sigma-70 factor (ECF subfamily)
MRTNAIPESDLIERLSRRDPDALAVIYDRYAQPAYSVLLRITRDVGVAEDLLQELFMRVWNRARDYDAQRGAIGSWMLTIARNMAIDHVRSAHARFTNRLKPIEDIERVAGKNAGIESALDRSRTVQAAFSSLGEKEKQVVELAYFEGLSQTEIASKLGQPLGTVKSWTRSALGRLRAAIGEEARP